MYVYKGGEFLVYKSMQIHLQWWTLHFRQLQHLNDFVLLWFEWSCCKKITKIIFARWFTSFVRLIIYCYNSEGIRFFWEQCVIISFRSIVLLKKTTLPRVILRWLEWPAGLSWLLIHFLKNVGITG